jgi:hypothetical protein
MPMPFYIVGHFEFLFQLDHCTRYITSGTLLLLWYKPHALNVALGTLCIKLYCIQLVAFCCGHAEPVIVQHNNYSVLAEVRLGASPAVRSVEVQTPPASPTSSHQGPRLTPGGLLASFDKSILQVRFVFVQTQHLLHLAHPDLRFTLCSTNRVPCERKRNEASVNTHSLYRVLRLQIITF